MNVSNEYFVGYEAGYCDAKAEIEAEAIPKDQYETRLKADMVAMLTELQLEFEEIETGGDTWELAIKDDCVNLIQKKINKLKAESEPQESEGT